MQTHYAQRTRAKIQDIMHVLAIEHKSKWKNKAIHTLFVAKEAASRRMTSGIVITTTVHWPYLITATTTDSFL